MVMELLQPVAGLLMLCAGVSLLLGGLVNLLDDLESPYLQPLDEGSLDYPQVDAELDTTSPADVDYETIS